MKLQVKMTVNAVNDDTVFFQKTGLDTQYSTRKSCQAEASASGTHKQTKKAMRPCHYLSSIQPANRDAEAGRRKSDNKREWCSSGCLHWQLSRRWFSERNRSHLLSFHDSHWGVWPCFPAVKCCYQAFFFLFSISEFLFLLNNKNVDGVT